MTPEREAWIEKSIARAELSLKLRESSADRLALIRTLARLKNGRLNLSDESIILSEAERRLLPRFGLKPTGEGHVLRVDDSDLEELLPGIDATLMVDPDRRTVFANAPADAPLLRCSRHQSYTSEAQKAAVSALLSMPAGGSLMVSMPTGSGKSLLFQMAPLWWRRQEPGACVVVITPTIALADDHERTLRALPGLENSRALHGGVTGAARTELLDQFRRGEIPVLLLSPEAAFGSARAALMEAADCPERKFGLAARLVALFVDEAHIIESWGRSFRPDFQRLPALVESLHQRNPELLTVLLSATLPQAARDVLRQGYSHGPWLEVHAGTPRYDFDLFVKPYDGERERMEALLTVIDRAPRPAIIYTTMVEHAERVHAVLRNERSYDKVGLFTGDISDAEQRRGVIQDWADEGLDLVVATSAFGLGVDKQNVRAVIHACLPESAARYYQEIGRASRDGHQGLGVCLWTRWRPGERQTDDEVASDMATNSWLSREIAEKRWAALLQNAEVSLGVRRKLTVRLDAVRDGLSRYTGERNRRWNMSLLNLLQRAGAIRVEHVSEEDSGPPAWRFELYDDALLSPGPHWDAAWERVFCLRDAERAAAKEELAAFKRLMSGQRKGCLLTGVFELIEPVVEDLQPCGRCQVCRATARRAPQQLSTKSEGASWQSVSLTDRLPSGVLLVTPNDPAFDRGREQLIDRLAGVGIEQFVVPDEKAAVMAQAVAISNSRFGFLQTHSEWRRRGEATADVPTAVLLPPEETTAAMCLQVLKEIALDRPHQSFVVVGDAQRRLDGRPLSQTASQLAPYDEEALIGLAAARLDIVQKDLAQ